MMPPAAKPARRLLRLGCLLLLFCLAGGNFIVGLNWGLPSREADPFLFGSHPVWTGQQIMDLAGAWDDSGSRGADITMHPIDQRDKPVVLNDTDAQRAEIIRRYRLYSNQPDEMITFRSLSRMKPGQLKFDPSLYQYGGLWIYPIGALLKLASFTGMIALRTDLSFYLDHPDAFARFYLLARGYSVFWGLLGVAAMFVVAREWTGRFISATTAAGFYAAMPVVIDLAHEAKPHLAGTVLILATVFAAMRYVRSNNRRWAIATGVLAGAAMGMVLTGYVAFAVIPVMACLRPISLRQRVRITIVCTLMGLATFAVLNPYLPANLLLHRQVLRSNVGNYGTFYQPRITASGLLLSGKSLVEGMSPGPAIVGFIALITFTIRFIRDRSARIGLLLAAPALITLIQFVLLADGKTAEYARFALLVDVTLAIAAAALLGQLQLRAREKSLIVLLLFGTTLYFGFLYDFNFVADSRRDSTRRIATRTIEQYIPKATTIQVWAEPAPYCLPPVDLFQWQLVLMPRGSGPTGTAIAVRPVDQAELSPTGCTIIAPIIDRPRPVSPISWANKPIEMLKHNDWSDVRSGESK